MILPERTRETREGLVLLTAETKDTLVNGDSKRKIESWLFDGLVVPVQEIFVLPKLL